MNDTYYNDMLQRWQLGNVGKPTGGATNWTDWLAGNTNLAAARDQFRRLDPAAQGLTGAGQARWQFF